MRRGARPGSPRFRLVASVCLVASLISFMGNSRRPPIGPGAPPGEPSAQKAPLDEDDRDAWSPTDATSESAFDASTRNPSGTVARRARVLVVDDERLVGDSLR